MVRYNLRTKVILILMALFITVPLIIGGVMATPSEKQRVFDEAGLLTESEIINLENAAQDYSEKRETDFIILTTKDADNKDIQIYMEDLYDEKGFGYDKAHGNAAILTIDMKSREVYLAGFYKAEKYLDDKRLDQIRNKITPDLTNKDYYYAFSTFFKTADRYMDFRPGVNPENIFFKTSFQFFIALGLAGVLVFFMAYNSGGKVTTNDRTYRDKANTKVLSHKDSYIRTTVTKSHQPRNNNSGGSGGGGGGGRSSGGHSHSGSRGSF